LSHAIPKKRTVEIANKGKSKSIRLLWIRSFFPMTAEMPITKSMLAILEPIALAGTISVTPRKTAIIAEMSSGKEVPRPTMVTPIIKGEIPKDKPIFQRFVKANQLP